MNDSTAISNKLIHQREDFYRDLEKRSIEPLWRMLETAAQREPRVQSVPHIWKWSDVRSQMLRAGDLVTAQEAERRVLMLINPSYKANTARTVGLIFGGVQMIMPGEVAGTHRHSPNAQRFIIEGEGAYTAVDGERTIMRQGDFVLTPAWTWHDHGNETSKPMIWLDGLDLPFVNIADANFFEEYESHDRTQPIVRSNDDSLLRWGRNLRPTWETPADPSRSPILNYRWKVTRNTLRDLQHEPGSPYDGIILQYVNPMTGGSTLPTISAHLQLLRKGEHTRMHRHTSSSIYHVAEGTGRTTIADNVFDWEQGDTFVVPSWAWHEHESCEDEAVLFSYTDRPILSAFGLYREEAEKGAPAFAAS